MASITKELVFVGKEGQDMFTVLWIALTYLPQPNGRQLSTEKRREEGKLISKLKKKSKDVKQPVGDDRFIISRELESSETIIELEQHEIELIRTRIDEYPHYNPIASDIVAETYDWLGTGKDIEKK